MIQSSCRLLIETKVKRNSVQPKQLSRHLTQLDDASETTCLLLLLTPDNSKPAAVDGLKDGRLVSASFAALDQAVDELLDDKSEVISEREVRWRRFSGQ